MSIPLDRLYHYIESVAQDIYRGNVSMFYFFPFGSKDIDSLTLGSTANGWTDYIFAPQIYCHDQEPLNYDLYKNEPIRDHRVISIPGNERPKRNLRISSGQNFYDKCIVLHSEHNGHNLIKYTNDLNFIPVYYWSHAIIALDWFRYAKHASFSKNIRKKFLIYNRAWSGTREYRIKFSELIINNNLLDFCKTNFNSYDQGVYYKEHNFSNLLWKPGIKIEEFLSPTHATSCYSADIDTNDYKETEIEVVLETLFDDDRNHLTEKSLRPIAVGHPFILASTPGSLKYLKKYGFKTFDSVFDESYDLIIDPLERLNAIIKLMKDINNWTPEQHKLNTIKLNEITSYNKNYFFSDVFFKNITNELRVNLSVGLETMVNTNTGRHFLSNDFRKIPGAMNFVRSVTTKKERVSAILKARSLRDCKK